MLDKEKPKNLSELCESLHFYYELRDKPNFDNFISWVKSNFTESQLRYPIFDMIVLLKGDHKNPRYAGALERYFEYNSNFNHKDRKGYQRFLLEMFNNHPPTKVEIKQPPKYRIPYDIIQLLQSQQK